MKKWMKIILLLFIVGIIAAGLGYKFVYNKPHTNYEKATAEYFLKATELFNQFRSDTKKAQSTYNGKVIEISGKLSNIETTETLTIAVFAIEEGMFGDEGLRCTMLENHTDNLSEFTGKTITIKGYCTGYNDMDVILEKCSIIKN